MQEFVNDRRGHRLNRLALAVGERSELGKELFQLLMANRLGLSTQADHRRHDLLFTKPFQRVLNFTRDDGFRHGCLALACLPILFDHVLQALAEAAEPATEPLAIGQERRPLAGVWEVLEVFPAFGDDVPPERLAAGASEVLGGWAPDAAGVVDHNRLGDLWKGKRGAFSVGEALLDQLAPYDPDTR
jgi:hypothetical protein